MKNGKNRENGKIEQLDILDRCFLIRFGYQFRFAPALPTPLMPVDDANRNRNDNLSKLWSIQKNVENECFCLSMST